LIGQTCTLTWFFAVLPAAVRVWLEDFMTTAPHRYQSEFARRYYSQGEAKGEVKALLAFLGARGIDVPSEVRAEIEGCTDTTRIEEWIRRAATADKIEDVLDW
jgi:hypothetical protein